MRPLPVTGNTDAIIAWVTNIALFKQQAASAGKDINVIRWPDAGLSLYSSAVVASDSFLSERPDVAKRFLRAFDKSLKFTSENPRKAAEALNSMVPEVDVERLPLPRRPRRVDARQIEGKIDGVGHGCVDLSFCSA